MEGHALNTHGSHLALTLLIRLLGVDDPCLRQHMTIPLKKKKKKKKKQIQPHNCCYDDCTTDARWK